MERYFFNLIKDILFYGVMGGISSLIGLILLPVFTHVFEPDEYGVLEILVTFTALMIISIRLSLTQAIARYYFDIEDSNRRAILVTTVFIFLIFLGGCILILGTIFSSALSELLLKNREVDELIIMAFVTAYLSVLSNVPQLVLRLQRKIIKYNIANLLHTLSYVFVALYLVLELKFGIKGVIIASLVSALVQLVVTLVWIRDHIVLNFVFSLLVQCLKFSIPLFPSVFVGWVNKQIDRIILLSTLGFSGVGLYAAGAKVSGIILLIIGIFRQAWIPFAMSMIKMEEHDRNEFFRKAFNYYAGAFSCMGLGLTAIAPELLDILVASKYQSVYVVVPWLVGAAVLQASIEFSGIAALISEKTLIMSLAAWSGAVLNAVLGFSLIPVFGISGAAIGGFIAAIISNVILLSVSCRLSSLQFDLSRIFKMLIFYILGVLLIMYINYSITNIWLSFVFRFFVFISISIYIFNQMFGKELYLSIKSIFAYRIRQARS